MWQRYRSQPTSSQSIKIFLAFQYECCRKSILELSFTKHVRDRNYLYKITFRNQIICDIILETLICMTFILYQIILFSFIRRVDFKNILNVYKHKSFLL